MRRTEEQSAEQQQWDVPHTGFMYRVYASTTVLTYEYMYGYMDALVHTSSDVVCTCTVHMSVCTGRVELGDDADAAVARVLDEQSDLLVRVHCARAVRALQMHIYSYVWGIEPMHMRTRAVPDSSLVLVSSRIRLRTLSDSAREPEKALEYSKR